MKILQFHGRESSPKTRKAQHIRDHTPHEVYVPAYPSQNRPVEESFSESYAIAKQALIDTNPDIVIGSSYGGGILLKLITQGLWEGPSLFLAGAGVHYKIAKTLPKHIPTILIHGTHDSVIDVQDSRLLAASSSNALLVEIADNHGLGTILDGLLILSVRHLCSLVKR